MTFDDSAIDDEAEADGLPATLPPINSANLPQTYEAARLALAECARIDECQDWADKAAALASYAKQADDDHLEKMSIRIRGRAIRRAGELLQQVKEQRGANQNIKDASGPKVLTRKDAAREAGMSERQTKTAIRVANVPDEEFERQIESPMPPTVTALAKQGTKPREKKPIVDLKGRDPAEFNRALHFVGDIEYAARDLSALDVDGIAPTLTQEERARTRKSIALIDAVSDRIKAEMAK